MKRGFILHLLSFCSSFVLLYLFILRVGDISFIPSIGNAIMRNFFLVISLCLVTTLVILFSRVKYRNWIYVLLGVIFSMVILVRTFVLAGYYSSYKQTIQHDLGNKYYIVNTYEPGFIPVCASSNAVVKTRYLFFTKTVAFIGCGGYEIVSSDKNKVKILFSKSAFETTNFSDSISVQIK